MEAKRKVWSDIKLEEDAIYKGELSGMFLHQIMGNRPLAGWSNFRLPVKKLYLCGASTSTSAGSGVSCGGRTAVQVVMGDLGIDFEKVASG